MIISQNISLVDSFWALWQKHFTPFHLSSVINNKPQGLIFKLDFFYQTFFLSFFLFCSVAGRRIRRKQSRSESWESSREVGMA
jgi:hypothetical protein